MELEPTVGRRDAIVDAMLSSEGARRCMMYSLVRVGRLVVQSGLLAPIDLF